MENLKKKNLIDEEINDTLVSVVGANRHILERQLKKLKGFGNKTYGPELRQFALNLNFLPPKAYCYVRESFSCALPHPRTISSWFQSVDSKPGFISEAFATIKGL